ncbi:MAG TPA: Minf_1886 family protein, partial [Gemmatimonadales bacterium]|nr:Minf_1886 family protein [Gemmatimonadales bacterium]
MNGLQFADEVLERIRQQEDRYDQRAYLFVLAALEFLQSKLPERRHVTGAELAWACRDFAVRQYGLLAFGVLTYWGVRRTEDIGRIVFVLVHTKVLSAEPTDREQDFAGVYDFAAAFGEP